MKQTNLKVWLWIIILARVSLGHEVLVKQDNSDTEEAKQLKFTLANTDTTNTTQLDLSPNQNPTLQTSSPALSPISSTLISQALNASTPTNKIQGSTQATDDVSEQAKLSVGRRSLRSGEKISKIISRITAKTGTWNGTKHVKNDTKHNAETVTETNVKTKVNSNKKTNANGSTKAKTTSRTKQKVTPTGTSKTKGGSQRANSSKTRQKNTTWRNIPQFARPATYKSRNVTTNPPSITTISMAEVRAAKQDYDDSFWSISEFVAADRDRRSLDGSNNKLNDNIHLKMIGPNSIKVSFIPKSDGHNEVSTVHSSDLHFPVENGSGSLKIDANRQTIQKDSGVVSANLGNRETQLDSTKPYTVVSTIKSRWGIEPNDTTTELLTVRDREILLHIPITKQNATEKRLKRAISTKVPKSKKIANVNKNPGTSKGEANVKSASIFTLTTGKPKGRNNSNKNKNKISGNSKNKSNVKSATKFILTTGTPKDKKNLLSVETNEFDYFYNLNADISYE